MFVAVLVRLASHLPREKFPFTVLFRVKWDQGAGWCTTMYNYVQLCTRLVQCHMTGSFPTRAGSIGIGIEVSTDDWMVHL